MYDRHKCTLATSFLNSASGLMNVHRARLESVENEDIIKIFMAKKSRRLELECISGCNMFLFTFCSITKIVLKTILHMKHHATVQIECERYKSCCEKILKTFLRIFSRRLLYRSRSIWTVARCFISSMKIGRKIWFKLQCIIVLLSYEILQKKLKNVAKGGTTFTLSNK